MYNCHVEYVEHVLVTVVYQTSYRGDIEVYLESPWGTLTKLLRFEQFGISIFISLICERVAILTLYFGKLRMCIRCLHGSFYEAVSVFPCYI